jgi:hypothetical protein
MLRLADWHYEKVPRLGTVHFSPKAMRSLQDASIGSEELGRVLELGRDIKDHSVAHGGWREHAGVRLELRTWPHMKGAAVVCIDGWRVKP